MSEIKALEKLRKSLKDCTNKAGVEPNQFNTYWITANACDMLIDDVEAEIADNYMRLPCDADGVPIHVGEHVRGKYTDDKTLYKVHGFMFDFEHSQWNIALNESRFASSNLLVRCEPRTLENIVADAIQYGHNGITGDRIEGKVAEFCAEIRELMKEGGND